MGKMFGNLTTDNLETPVDRLGGGGNNAIPTGVYDAVIKVAYAGQSQAGAHNVTLVLDVAGQEVRETIYITNRDGENFFVDKQDNTKKHPLPGFTTVDDICLLATGESLTEQETEPKMVKIYDFDERKEVPTEVPVLTGLTGKNVTVGVLRVIEDKQKKDDSGKYVTQFDNEGKPLTRTSNSIDKVFHPETKRTVAEYRHEVETPEFHDAWKKANTKDRDKTTKPGAPGAGAPGASGAGRPGGDAATPKKKLFGK